MLAPSGSPWGRGQMVEDTFLSLPGICHPPHGEQLGQRRFVFLSLLTDGRDHIKEVTSHRETPSPGAVFYSRGNKEIPGYSRLNLSALERAFLKSCPCCWLCSGFRAGAGVGETLIFLPQLLGEHQELHAPIQGRGILPPGVSASFLPKPI